ncbi:MAG: flagellar basal-body rod protein FlgF [Acidobacteriia bacterium]|nr:flagellar basal-body rod protein FlgF [Terriglobia bacterium]
MDSGYYAACAGLKAQTQALEVVANNLANINTSGYRGQQPTFRSLLASASGAASNPLNRAINDFNVLGSSRVDLGPGSLERTGNPLDLAIEGNAFFAVETKAGTLYTRNGSFQVSVQGELTTGEGDRVLGEQGPLRVPSGTASISADGTLSVNGAVAGKVRLVEFAPASVLVPQGRSYYSAPDGAAQPATGAYVRQGMVEASNVNPVAAMVGLIAVQRHAEMLQRALSLFHSDFNRIAADELPRV